MVIVREWFTEVIGEHRLGNALSFATFSLIESGFVGGTLASIHLHRGGGVVALWLTLAVLCPVATLAVFASKLSAERRAAVSLDVENEAYFFAGGVVTTIDAGSSPRSAGGSFRRGFIYLRSDGVHVFWSAKDRERITYEQIAQVQCVRLRGCLGRGPQLRLVLRGGGRATFAPAYPGIRGARIFALRDMLRLCAQIDRRISTLGKP